MVVSPHARFHSTEEIVAIADRIYLLVEAERTIRLTPATGWLVEKAVRSFAARPPREQVIKIICGKSGCNYSTCMICMGKANAIMQLYENESRDKA
jgi:hypothetical protein